ncbi:hypothetical protein QWJ34_23160 [Saccharibacillus sp. CPCC 101409]|uniref:VOC family protein n=1 Tax=Saccharibacillus sp. CPCC 101409 TaxID=3058041 RepID=UPI002673DBA6|nr:hypothetical protein [Saccharibacillus sp. CPCC 101409]MDO3412685.1 hypothetical protein [Saccharibacillus sp. CPCC 101409]
MSETFYEQPMQRLLNDTSGREPRTLIRVFVGPGRLEETIDYYEQLQQVARDAFFPYPEAGLYLAMVGSFLIIEGSDEQLAPYRQTTGTLLVDDVQPYYDRLLADGAEIVGAIRDVPTGRGFTARHRDGTVVEYVHHRPDPQGR